MKVLFPATHYYPVIGGIENWTQNIAEKLAPEDEVFIVTGRVKYQPEKQELNGVKIWRTSLFALSNLSASPLIYTVSLLPFIFLKSLFLIKKERIDIMHCQGFLSSFLGYLLSLLTGVPFVATVQRLEEKKNYFKNFIYRRASACIGASMAIKTYFKEIGCKKVEVVPNGIDLKRFEDLGRKPHEGFVVITVARLEAVKGIEYLIKAISNLKSQISNLQLFIAGDGSERKNLEKLTQDLDLEEKVKFLGQIPPEGIPEYLSRADCFVLPSVKEGFGIAILESLAAGVPVVASRVGGILDIIEDGKTGLLVDPKNPEAISRAIYEIYSGRKFAKADLGKYNWQDIAGQVRKIYQQINSLKIVFAAGIYPPDIGGPATYVARLAKELNQPVISYSGKLKNYPKGVRYILYFFGLLWLAKNTNVIYAQNVTSAGLPALVAAKLLRKKFVLKIVGDAAWEQKKDYLKQIQGFVAKGADRIIVPSQYVKKMVIGWGVMENKIEVIYNAVEIESVSPEIGKEEARKKIGIDGNIILSVGRPVPWKGFGDLRAIMPDLLERNQNFRLVIVGEDKKVPHEQMPLYFLAADIFILNSGYEGLSHVILEAMNFGVPVIASREGGNPELIEDNFNGLLVEYKNKEQIKEAILRLWQDKDLREKFIKNSYEKLKNFSWENLIRKTSEVLKP